VGYFYICSVYDCNFITTDSKALSSHVTSVHNTKNYNKQQCSICFEFVTNGRWGEHCTSAVHVEAELNKGNNKRKRKRSINGC